MLCRLTLLVSVRLAGFRLMEAGLEAKPTVEGSFLRSLKFVPLSTPSNYSPVACASDSLQDRYNAVRYVISNNKVAVGDLYRGPRARK